MQRQDFLDTFHRCAEKADLLCSYKLTVDPEEISDLMIDEEDFIHFDDVKTPYRLADVLKIQYSKPTEYDAGFIRIKFQDQSSLDLKEDMNCTFTIFLPTNLHHTVSNTMQEAVRYLGQMEKARTQGKFNDSMVIVDTSLVLYRGDDKNVVVPDGVEVIEADSFCHVMNMDELTLPASLKIIGARAFRGYDSLKAVVLPDGINEIHRAAFFGCSSLTHICIPEKVKTIGPYAFSHCSALTEVVIMSKETEIDPTAFDISINET